MISASIGIMLFSLLQLALFIFWIFMIIDVVKSEFRGENDKLIWLLVTILLGPLGALIYHFVGKKSKIS
jgi:Phospholipase_D-nuclease N-terminal